MTTPARRDISIMVFGMSCGIASVALAGYLDGPAPWWIHAAGSILTLALALVLAYEKPREVESAT